MIYIGVPFYLFIRVQCERKKKLMWKWGFFFYARLRQVKHLYSQLKLPKPQAAFLPDKANFCRNHWFISKKFNALWQKNHR